MYSIHGITRKHTTVPYKHVADLPPEEDLQASDLDAAISGAACPSSGGTRTVTFSTTYSESAYPSTCEIFELASQTSAFYPPQYTPDTEKTHLFNPFTFKICAEL